MTTQESTNLLTTSTKDFRKLSLNNQAAIIMGVAQVLRESLPDLAKFPSVDRVEEILDATPNPRIAVDFYHLSLLGVDISKFVNCNNPVDRAVSISPGTVTESDGMSLFRPKLGKPGEKITWAAEPYTWSGEENQPQLEADMVGALKIAPPQTPNKKVLTASLEAFAGLTQNEECNDQYHILEAVGFLLKSNKAGKPIGETVEIVLVETALGATRFPRIAYDCYLVSLIGFNLLHFLDSKKQ